MPRRIFERAPSVPGNRIALSRCYDRLALWGGRAGKRAEAAAAIREREKLWPDDAEKLREVARDFQVLAEALSGSRGPLSPEEQAEQHEYIRESDRAKRAADDAARRVGNAAIDRARREGTPAQR